MRLAELVASLSLATDLGLGQPEEHVLRQTVIATRLAALAGLDEEEQAATFYVSLLAWVGCISDSPEMAYWFGDDRQIRAMSYQVDKAGMPMMRMMLSHVALGSGSWRRMTMIGRFLAGGFSEAATSFVTHCATTGDIADRLGLDDRVRGALAQAFERWDGKGTPGTSRGDQIETVMRVVQVADDAEVFHRTRGLGAALEMLRERRGTEFDPGLVDLCAEQSEAVFGDLDAVDAWSTVIAGCAALDREVGPGELDGVLEIFADYADLKSTWYLGHSRAVATLAASAARTAGMGETDVALVRRAALVHRIGATGVSTATWDKETLTSGERERVRTVPYLTERICSRQPELAGIGAIAAMAHERSDGSGYPRGSSGAAIPPTARILAAADVYQTLAEDRPGRPALDGGARRAVCEEEVRAGRLDADAVRSVLAAAGHPVRRRRTAVAGLTAREVDVLRLLVRGRSNKEIAQSLSISSRTAATHIEHIFAKTDVTSRGAAAMFALRHGLVDAGADSGQDERSGDLPM
ncbi:MAG: HD domain-containing phosphohydrolase [Marmoricola sp.]